jgi:hypothetical protein
LETSEKQGSILAQSQLQLASFSLSLRTQGQSSETGGAFSLHEVRERKKEMCRADEAINHFAFTDFF